MARLRLPSTDLPLLCSLVPVSPVAGYYTRCWESTMVISLLQPSTEVMELFDDLLLLAQG